jgi:hypothetical protein
MDSIEAPVVKASDILEAANEKTKGESEEGGNLLVTFNGRNPSLDFLSEMALGVNYFTQSALEYIQGATGFTAITFNEPDKLAIRKLKEEEGEEE